MSPEDGHLHYEELTHSDSCLLLFYNPLLASALDSCQSHSLLVHSGPLLIKLLEAFLNFCLRHLVAASSVALVPPPKAILNTMHPNKNSSINSTGGLFSTSVVPPLDLGLGKWRLARPRK